jgi:hypothetical protein
MKLRKLVNVVALFVLVSVNVFTPFSYAGLDDVSAQENNATEIEEPTIVNEPNNETEDENNQEDNGTQNEETDKTCKTPIDSQPDEQNQGN